MLPADFTHRNLALNFDKLNRSKQRLNRIFNPLRIEYNLIILDCPPAISLLAENMFNVADCILVPLFPQHCLCELMRYCWHFSKSMNTTPIKFTLSFHWSISARRCTMNSWQPFRKNSEAFYRVQSLLYQMSRKWALSENQFQPLHQAQ